MLGCSIDTAERLSAQRNSDKLNVCIQVNIDADNKGGVMPDKVKSLAAIIDQLQLNLRGLMTVLQKHDKLEADRQSYHQLKNLFLRKWF